MEVTPNCDSTRCLVQRAACLQVAELKKYMKHQFTDKEIVDLVAEKKRFQKNPTNFAVRKHEVMKEKVCVLYVDMLSSNRCSTSYS